MQDFNLNCIQWFHKIVCNLNLVFAMHLMIPTRITKNTQKHSISQQILEISEIALFPSKERHSNCSRMQYFIQATVLLVNFDYFHE